MRVDILTVYCAGTLVGLVLLFTGAIGTRVDNHPICRRCGYDLFGRDRSNTHCSECGADLGAKRAVRDGRRRRRPTLIWIGIAVFLLTLFTTGSNLYMEAKGISSWRLKPTWLIRREANGTGSTSGRAVSELQDRLVKGRLDSSEAKLVLDDALQHQADFTSHRESDSWLWLFETAAARALPTDDQWKRYVQQAAACKFTLRTRKIIRIGDPIPLEIRSDEVRAQQWSYLNANWDASLTLDDVDLPLTNSPFPTTFGFYSYWWLWHELPDAEIYKHVKPGDHTLRVKLRGSVSLGVPANQTRYQPIPVSYSLQCPLKLIQSSIETIRLIDDANLSKSIEQSLSIRRRPGIAAVSVRDGHVSYAGPEMELAANAPPVGLSHDVVVMVGGSERIVGTLTCARGASTVMDLGTPEELKGAKVVLRPKPSAALETIDCIEIWGRAITVGEIVTEPTTEAANRNIAATKKGSGTN